MSGESPLVAVVLSGGASRRMGRDKASLPVDGACLLDRALARLQPVASTVILASGSTPVTRPGCVTVTDSVAQAGPLAGIVAALEVSPEPVCAVVAVDMPDIDPGLLLALAGRATGVDAAVPLSSRGPEPLHAAYARSALPGLWRALASCDRSLGGGLARLRVRYVSAAALSAAPAFARNLNTPDDLTSWEADQRAASQLPH